MVIGIPARNRHDKNVHFFSSQFAVQLMRKLIPHLHKALHTPRRLLRNQSQS